MINFIIIFFVFLISGCQSNNSPNVSITPELENISFDVVEKRIFIETEIPSHMQMLFSQWFEQKVKIDGFDGEMSFTIFEYSEEISSIDNGKRVDISISFNVILNKPSLSQIKTIEGYVNSYGILTGNFSINEFDTLIKNTQSDLILRLSRDLKSKI